MSDLRRLAENSLRSPLDLVLWLREAHRRGELIEASAPIWNLQAYGLAVEPARALLLDALRLEEPVADEIRRQLACAVVSLVLGSDLPDFEVNGLILWHYRHEGASQATQALVLPYGGGCWAGLNRRVSELWAEVPGTPRIPVPWSRVSDTCLLGHALAHLLERLSARRNGEDLIARDGVLADALIDARIVTDLAFEAGEPAPFAPAVLGRAGLVLVQSGDEYLRPLGRELLRSINMFGRGLSDSLHDLTRRFEAEDEDYGRSGTTMLDHAGVRRLAQRACLYLAGRLPVIEMTPRQPMSQPSIRGVLRSAIGAGVYDELTERWDD